jgi:luciferase family oxidoreductase group 1
MKNLSNTEISVLDLARIPAHGTIADAFAKTKAAAQHVEKLGYKRFWMAEHHSIDGIASAATSVLIGHVAEHTKTIRIGSGGIMLPNHAPIVIAEQFGTLATLYPGRIDLGLGRAPGSDRETMRAMRRDNPQHGADFGDLIEELLHYFSAVEPGQKVKAIPGAGIDVPIYILGSSTYSAELAARLGRPYAFAGHFAPAEMLHAFDIYRRQFRPSSVLKKPYVMAGIPVIAADSDEKAEYLATSLKQTFLALIRGGRVSPQPPIESMEALWNPRERNAVESMLGLLVTGSSKTVRAKLDAFIGETQADELIITSDPYDSTDRLRSFELIMDAKIPDP